MLGRCQMAMAVHVSFSQQTRDSGLIDPRSIIVECITHLIVVIESWKIQHLLSEAIY